MEKPNVIESVIPGSGQYSCKQDLRLNAWLLVATVVYLTHRVVLAHHPELSPAVRSVVALTPLLPALLYLRDWVHFIRTLDELQRRVQLEAHLFAAWGTLITGIVLSILNQHGVLQFLPHGLGFGGVMVLILPLWLLGIAITNRRYK